MPYDPALAQAMRKALSRRKDIVEKKMFGGYCWMLDGNMLCGVEVGRYMFRVGKAQEAEALARAGARPMDITGKPMAGFVWVDAAHAEAGKLIDWIELAANYVGSLPKK
jgi:TfoX/Sxy family transcriptional regulator of competence genes